MIRMLFIPLQFLECCVLDLVDVVVSSVNKLRVTFFLCSMLGVFLKNIRKINEKFHINCGKYLRIQIRIVFSNYLPGILRYQGFSRYNFRNGTNVNCVAVCGKLGSSSSWRNFFCEQIMSYFLIFSAWCYLENYIINE